MRSLADEARKTYGYLRLSMAALLAMLWAAVAIEWIRTNPTCLQTSISGYYYTAAGAVFVAALVAIGVGMVVLKGSTDAEDILLNLGGMLAPVVALVPTPGPGVCRSVPLETHDIDANVLNNVGALFAAGVLGLVVTIVVALKEDRAPGEPRSLKRADALGIGVAVTAYGAGLVWFFADRDSFVHGAHYVAAGGLFAAIVGVVLANGLDYRRARLTSARRDLANRYVAIAITMIVSAAVMGLWRLTVGWEHWLLGVEGALITLFLVFWLFQTRELWRETLRA